jgi:hypothetical protein
VDVGGESKRKLRLTHGNSVFRAQEDAAGVDHQVCTVHIQRNTEAWVTAIDPALAVDADESLATIGLEPVQAIIHRCHLGAAFPPTDGPMSLTYRLRFFRLDRWNP